jgi:hypothetical protein
MTTADTDTALVQSRLLEAANAREPLELVLVLRGKVRPVRGQAGSLWTVRIAGGRGFKFPADAVLAVTSLPRRRPLKDRTA